MAGGSWLDPIQATLASCATAALQAGEEAGAGVMAQLAEALTRLQALPGEASAAVVDLSCAIADLFPVSEPPFLASAHALAPESRCAPACPDTIGQAGPAWVTVWPAPGASARRGRVDSAGLARFLRAQHPQKPAEHVAACTGIPLDTVSKLLKRETLPVGRTMMLFVAAYGPELLAAVLPDADDRWLEGARILADQARLEAELARTRAAMAANTGRWTFCGIAFGGGA